MTRFGSYLVIYMTSEENFQILFFCDVSYCCNLIYESQQKKNKQFLLHIILYFFFRTIRDDFYIIEVVKNPKNDYIFFFCFLSNLNNPEDSK